MTTARTFFARLCLSVLLCTTLASPGDGRANEDMSGNPEQKTYTFGIVPQFAAREIREIWRPILQAIEAETGLDFVIRGAPTIPDFEREFMIGEFDFAYMNPYHLVLAHEAQGYIPLVRDVGRQLRGVLVVPVASAIKSLADLEGRVIALPAPNALGASLMMRADLTDIHKVTIQPSYVKTHSSVYLNVILGDAAAGGGVQKTFDQQPASIREQLRILYETRSVAPHPIAAHARVDTEVRSRVTRGFMSVGATDTGRALLARIPMQKIGPTSLTDYESLHEMGLERYYSVD